MTRCFHLYSAKQLSPGQLEASRQNPDRTERADGLGSCFFMTPNIAEHAESLNSYQIVSNHIKSYQIVSNQIQSDQSTKSMFLMILMLDRLA